MSYTDALSELVIMFSDRPLYPGDADVIGPRNAVEQQRFDGIMRMIPSVIDMIERVSGQVAEYREAAEMACEEPVPGCECPGCSLARAKYAGGNEMIERATEGGV